MDDTSTRKKIDRIIMNPRSTVNEKVDALNSLRDEILAHRRSLETSGIVEEADMGDDLQQIDNALQDLDISPDSFKGTDM